VTAIGRRKLGISPPKLKEVLHQDFADCSALADPLSGQDAAVFCLGTYTGAVPDMQLYKVTVDYTVEFARVLHTASPAAAFSFLGGSGADQTGRSRPAFARYKGEAEKALLATAFSHVFRPVSLSETQSGWQVESNWVMLLVDERCLQPDLVGADRIVPVASVAAGRDLDASSSTQRAAT
jgi:hypothetical protein